jgi:rubrerythrin
MDLKKYKLEDLILTALKAETDSKDIYTKLADRVENFLLKDRLSFLANEELKHYQFFERLYKQDYPDKNIILPEKSPVPLPEISITDNIPISDILQSAMHAEKSAHDFYLGIAEQYHRKPEIEKMLIYIAKMEMGHYRLIEIEKENAEKFEGYNMDFPLMHIGA